MADETLPEIWQDPAKSIAEMLLSGKLEQTAPALSQIPLLSIAIAAYKSKGAISDYLLTKKVQQFYSAWERLDEGERKRIYRKFQKKPRAFVEKLLFILAQQEDLAKCHLLGVLTTSYLRGYIKRADYLDLIETVAHLSLSDLRLLMKMVDAGMIIPQDELGERYAVLFVSRGLLVTEPNLPSEQRSDDEQIYYRITKLGSLFAERAAQVDLKEPA